MTDSHASDFDAALRAVMDELAHEVDTLHATLVDERMALDQGDAPSLEVAGRAKSHSLDRIEKLDVERRHLSDAANVDSLNDPRWSHTIDRLLECRRMNEVNGRIVGQRIGQVRQALALISGDAQGGATYGPDGAARIKLRSATLAQV
ncbi:flagellar protein FlgN [Luteibacter anthropi]|uniref:Flagellar protein FlgN n=1 Tax=Luteibacter anthropi TaxID=564369 RepID=A0A7X5ZJ56_9GAMM|nr:flagellar protein FlgN [Luteibacter anthropi]NII07623.1 flagellar protein FlgN [Luteibacter anthropi]URX60925.1 flagellar protein FlgN [Luteibacter anthropi]